MMSLYVAVVTLTVSKIALYIPLMLYFHVKLKKNMTYLMRTYSLNVEK